MTQIFLGSVGLYNLARKGLIKCFTGINSPYEEPLTPDLKISTKVPNETKCVEQILKLLEDRNFI
ncbi:adenylyl-sulfate kinase [Echinicola rosea]|uniref:APS kinase domain-containing protein n=1 Tax=Echinicola rosea TaxID=1807691 RepID=A0ABQ1V1B0_9BACT|nr:adenylyl-sulfate kinase [Echinicola rosea]GGF31594.1 hypothetical protein GCM10011339_19780 [Echinicola rosea]